MRKSDLKEETKGKSVEQQRSKCEMAAKVLGYEIDERLVFEESDGAKGYFYWEDSEGRNPPPFRPELTRLVHEIEAGNVDALMVWRSDRLVRDEVVAALLGRKLRAHGVRLLALTLDYQLHTTSGLDNFMADAIRNRSYSDRIADDVYRNHEAKALAGEVYKDPSCLGFRSGTKGMGQVVPVPTELDLVRLIFDLYVYGPAGGAPLSAFAIADYLMRHGHQVAVGAKNHKCRDRARVHPGQVTSILKNVSYVGQQNFGGVAYDCPAFLVDGPDGQKETVVPRFVFDRAQEMRLAVGQFGKDRRAKLLNGILVCPCCGRKMYAHSRGVKYAPSIVCQERGGLFGTCQGEGYRTLALPTIEDWVKSHLAPILIAELQALRAERAGEPLGRELAAAERQLEVAKSRESKELADLVGVLDAVQLSAVASELRRQRQNTERRVAELRSRARGQVLRREDPFDLASETQGTLRAALLRAVRWIAVTDQGIVVLTRNGAYIGARLARGDKRSRGGHRPPKILPPSVEATKACLSWIRNRETFLEGLRRGGHWSAPPPNHELCPEYEALGMAFTSAV